MTGTGWLIEPEGPVPYALANDEMHELARRRLAGEIPDTLLLLQHPPVFTAGRRAKPEDLLWSPDELHDRGVEAHRIDRGGSFTFHGPGQLVGYPIVDLGPSPDAARHLRRMEEAVMRAASDLGITLERRPDVQTGVWSGDRKVCAIGVRLLRARVTMHGFAVNCSTDLSWFSGIVPCGLPDHGVTSLTELAGRTVTVEDLLPLVTRRAAEAFGTRYVAAPSEIAERFSGAAARV